ncbi:hypothetical protein DIPPA_26576 [Diplonema papillatum]|nr:hypothetical protein DIPPA_26576 [Diplonema papillatum]
MTAVVCKGASNMLFSRIGYSAPAMCPPAAENTEAAVSSSEGSRNPACELSAVETLPKPFLGTACDKKVHVFVKRTRQYHEDTSSSSENDDTEAKVPNAGSPRGCVPGSPGRAVQRGYRDIKNEFDAETYNGDLNLVAHLQPWVIRFLQSERYGKGGIHAVSSTVIVAEDFVVKATTKVEAKRMSQVQKVCDSETVPQLYSSLPAKEAFLPSKVPANTNTVVIYYKRKGVVASDLVTHLTRRYIANPEDDTPLSCISAVVDKAVVAAKTLFSLGIVHQDLWLGNIVLSSLSGEAEQGSGSVQEYQASVLSFLDVGDCCMAGHASFLGSVGGLCVSTLCMLLGIVAFDTPQNFTPEYLWKDRPLPWWIHTHWTPPSQLCDSQKALFTRELCRTLLFTLPVINEWPVIKIGLVTHLERFVGIRHPMVLDFRKTALAGTKYVTLSVKRAALASGMMTQQMLKDCLTEVRGAGLWTVLRQELGRPVADEIRSCVARKLNPAPNDFGSPCPIIDAPATPPTRLCTGLLPSSLTAHQIAAHTRNDHPYGQINLASQVPPTPCDTVRGISIDHDLISNFITIEHMMLCGELSEDITVLLSRWSMSYGFDFKSPDELTDI